MLGRTAMLVACVLLSGCMQADRVCPDGLPCYAETRSNTPLMAPRGRAPNPIAEPPPQRGVMLLQGNALDPGNSFFVVADFDTARLTVIVTSRPVEGRRESPPPLRRSRPLARDEIARLIPLANDIWSAGRFAATHRPLMITDDFKMLRLFAGGDELGLVGAHLNRLTVALDEVAAPMRQELREAARPRP